MLKRKFIILATLEIRNINLPKDAKKLKESKSKVNRRKEIKMTAKIYITENTEK